MAECRTKRAVGTPRWVKGFSWAGAVAILLVIVMLASGHGPWQHLNVSGMH
jgi:hypothetical protein